MVLQIIKLSISMFILFKGPFPLPEHLDIFSTFCCFGGIFSFTWWTVCMAVRMYVRSFVYMYGFTYLFKYICTCIYVCIFIYFFNTSRRYCIIEFAKQGTTCRSNSKMTQHRIFETDRDKLLRTRKVTSNLTHNSRNTMQTRANTQRLKPNQVIFHSKVSSLRGLKYECMHAFKKFLSEVYCGVIISIPHQQHRACEIRSILDVAIFTPQKSIWILFK